ncbi:MAG: hypothetical protein K8953_11860, partial [Proteobacteria bacterium]|nr:hypothetical protein [Pseudomonadota bacterium]
MKEREKNVIHSAVSLGAQKERALRQLKDVIEKRANLWENAKTGDSSHIMDSLREEQDKLFSELHFL